MRNAPLRSLAALFLFPAAALAAPQSRVVRADGPSVDALRLAPPVQDGRQTDGASDVWNIEGRLEVLRLVRAAHAEHGWETAEATLGRCVHLAELVVSGADLAAQVDAAQGIPGPADLAEMAGRAASWYGEQQRFEEASACRELNAFYTARAEGREPLPPAVVDAGSPVDSRPEGLADDDERISDDQVELRIEVLRYATHLLQDAGEARGAEALRKMVHVGELYQSDASDEAVLEAYEAVNLEHLVYRLLQAGQISQQREHVGPARWCRRVARYYAEREGIDMEPMLDRLNAASFVPGSMERVESRDLTVRTERLQVLELAHGALLRGRDAEASERMGRILTLARLLVAQENGQDVQEQLSEIVSEGMNQQMIIDSVAQARDLFRKWNRPVQARDCERLVQYYEGRRDGTIAEPAEPTGRSRSAAPAEPAPPAASDAFDPTVRRQRARVLAAGAEVLAKAGDEAGADVLQRTVRLARIQLAQDNGREVPDEVLAEAVEGLSMQGIVDAVRAAADASARAGDRRSTRRFVTLAEFYEQRDGLARRESAPRQMGVDARGLQSDRAPQSDRSPQHPMEVRRRAEAARAQAEAVRAEAEQARRRVEEEAARRAHVEALEQRIEALEAQLEELHAKLKAVRDR